MIIGVTGATSGIGRRVLTAIDQRGHAAVRLTRAPSRPDDRAFDLTKPFDDGVLEGLDGLIHLAWDWTDLEDPVWGRNARAARAIAAGCHRRSIAAVLLSTFSVFAAGPSRYGTSKLVAEREFLAVGGSCLRAGVIWGGEEPAGIAQTMVTLAQLPGVCPHLSPSPLLYHSQRDVLADLLVQQAVAPVTGPRLVLAAAPEPVDMVDVVHHLEARTDKRVHVAVPTKWLIAASRGADAARIRVPFRTDSLRAADPKLVREVAYGDLPFAPEFPGREQFLAWMGTISPVAE